MFLSTETVSVAICSPHPIIREGLWKILAEEESCHIYDAPLPLERTVAWVEEMRPDVVLHDVRSTEETLAFLAAMKECHTYTKVTILLDAFLKSLSCVPSIKVRSAVQLRGATRSSPLLFSACAWKKN